MTKVDFDIQLRSKAGLVNDTVRWVLAGRQIDSELDQALRYTLESPGKRLRSALVLWCCELVSGGINRNAQVAAAAVEMVHTYSLVHDDLPAIDNDDIRRGRPACHKAFGEAMAILAGDALLTMAFEVLAKEIAPPSLAAGLLGQLAEHAGAAGMIAGQWADLKAENTQGTEQVLRAIHTNKTAKMFRCAAVMGAMCGNANEKQLRHLSEFGTKIGLAFQIADDILDVSCTSEHLGKTAGKDAKAAKCTYPAVVGIEKSRQLEKELARQAVAVLKPFGPRADILRQLVKALLQRTK